MGRINKHEVSRSINLFLWSFFFLQPFYSFYLAAFALFFSESASIIILSPWLNMPDPKPSSLSLPCHLFFPILLSASFVSFPFGSFSLWFFSAYMESQPCWGWFFNPFPSPSFLRLIFQLLIYNWLNMDDYLIIILYYLIFLFIINNLSFFIFESFPFIN